MMSDASSILGVFTVMTDEFCVSSFLMVIETALPSLILTAFTIIFDPSYIMYLSRLYPN